MTYLKKIKLSLLTLLIAYSGISQANGFQEATNALRSSMQKAGHSISGFNPNAPQATSLRNYLANHCFYNTKTENYGSGFNTYTQALVFYNNGRFSFKDHNSTDITYSGIIGTGRNNTPPTYGNWNVYKNPSNHTLIILDYDNYNITPMFAMSVDAASLNVSFQGGGSTLYRKLSINSCK